MKKIGFIPEQMYKDAYIRNGKIDCENEILYGIFDKDGVEVYSEQFSFGKALRMTKRLNENGEYKPYTMKAVN